MQSNYYYIAGLAVRMISGPITAILILNKFSPVNQGYYYLILSLVSSVTLFEAGLTMLMVRDGTKKTGEANLKVITLVSKVLKFVGISYLIAMVGAAPFFFLVEKTVFESIYLAAAIGLAGLSQIYILSATAILEALGDVNRAFRVKLITTISAIVVNLVLLYFFQRVESLAIGYIVTGLYLRVTMKTSVARQASIRNIDVKNYLLRNRKILFSYLSGYFLWSAMPIIVSTIKDVKTAGKYSISYALMMAVYQLYQTVYVTQRRKIIRDAKNNEIRSALSSVHYASTLLGLTLTLISVLISKTLTPEYAFRFLNFSELIILSLYVSVLFASTQKMNILRYGGGEPVFHHQLILNFSVPVGAAVTLHYSDSLALMIGCNFLIVALVYTHLTRGNSK